MPNALLNSLALLGQKQTILLTNALKTPAQAQAGAGAVGGDPNGIRTRIVALKGQCPNP